MLLTLSYAILWTLIGFNGGILVLTMRKLRIVKEMLEDLEEAARDLEAANSDAWVQMGYDRPYNPRYVDQPRRAPDH